MIYVIGVDSFIGKELFNRLLKSGHPVKGSTRHLDRITSNIEFLDLESFGDEQVWHPPVGVGVAIICAAMTKIDQCELDPIKSHKINVIGTYNLIKNLISHNVHVVFLSSSQIFDGSVHKYPADSPYSAILEYGKQKAELETKILKWKNQITIIRLSKVLDKNNTLLNGWLKALKNGQIIHPFTDMVMAPISLTTVISLISYLVLFRISGIFQLSGSRDYSYFEVATYIANLIGANHDLISPITSSEGGYFLHKPLHSTLDISAVLDATGFDLPDFEWVMNSVLTC